MQVERSSCSTEVEANMAESSNQTEQDVKLEEEDAGRVRERMLAQLTAELGLPGGKVRAAVSLLDEGNTIPFIARYRKEMTGELDENELRGIEERLAYLRGLQERKSEVLRLIGEQGKLTAELAASIRRAAKLQEVEDLYRPYRQKRKTRASVARERGLGPLAEWLLREPRRGSLAEEAAKYVSVGGEGVQAVDEAIQGALDIVAEQMADDAKVRAWARRYTQDNGLLTTAAKHKDQESVYEMYYSYTEPLKKLPPHRTLAINRGEREEVLKVSVEVAADKIVGFLSRQYIHGESVAEAPLLQAAEDAYKRLIAPAIEREVRGILTEQAEEQAIRIFSENLRNLLLQPPVKGKVVLGLDPAYRTGCKLAVVDETGKLLAVDVIYPTPPHNRVTEARARVIELIRDYRVELLVIGNGTASRETEQFVADLLRESGLRLPYSIVSEAGASVYSASKLAQEEFPELDVAERSAISIARRMQDPLAELVKIDPKAIGVGQYQHDVSQKRLEESLGGVVESAVNHVGVDVNTASPSLLGYVAGINATLAKNIVKQREASGKFTSRQELQRVPRLGAKAYEQCAGFLRIPAGADPLDATPIHPESYGVVERLLRLLGLDRSAIGSPEMRAALAAVKPEELADRLEVGVPTLRDIVESLLRPGRDPREELPPPAFRTDVLKLSDLSPGMELTGTVRNVIDFGAFVDIGIKNDGLVHISQLSNRFVKHPMDVVSVGDTVKVWVLTVDEKKGRVGLTMRGPAEQA
jgi:uncharacterized protein